MKITACERHLVSEGYGESSNLDGLRAVTQATIQYSSLEAVLELQDGKILYPWRLMSIKCLNIVSSYRRLNTCRRIVELQRRQTTGKTLPQMWYIGPFEETMLG